MRVPPSGGGICFCPWQRKTQTSLYRLALVEELMIVLVAQDMPETALKCLIRFQIPQLQALNICTRAFH